MKIYKKRNYKEINWSIKVPDNYNFNKIEKDIFRYDFEIEKHTINLIVKIDTGKINKKNVRSIILTIGFGDSLTGNKSNHLNIPFEILNYILGLLNNFIIVQLPIIIKKSSHIEYLIEEIDFFPYSEYENDNRRKYIYIDMWKSYANNKGISYHQPILNENLVIIELKKYIAVSQGNKIQFFHEFDPNDNYLTYEENKLFTSIINKSNYSQEDIYKLKEDIIQGRVKEKRDNKLFDMVIDDLKETNEILGKFHTMLFKDGLVKESEEYTDRHYKQHEKKLNEAGKSLDRARANLKKYIEVNRGFHHFTFSQIRTMYTQIMQFITLMGIIDRDIVELSIMNFENFNYNKLKKVYNNLIDIYEEFIDQYNYAVYFMDDIHEDFVIENVINKFR
jgi:hypothetical protein